MTLQQFQEKYAQTGVVEYVYYYYYYNNNNNNNY